MESFPPLPVHVDDEPFADTPVTIRAVPRALKVILPQEAPYALFSQEATRSRELAGIPHPLPSCSRGSAYSLTHTP